MHCTLVMEERFTRLIPRIGGGRRDIDFNMGSDKVDQAYTLLSVEEQEVIEMFQYFLLKYAMHLRGFARQIWR